ncbi:MAG: NAD(P)-dependent oxidoreductase [Clostridia bacterium]|nr:NAD(P)-dependent oxidoreductase [Clostridia bacterium]
MKEMTEKANYCLSCKIKPCSMKGCPLNNDIPEFIKCLKEKDYKGAYKVLSKTTVLPGVCGRICPHTKQCQGSCIRGIKGEPVSIGELEAFAYDMATKEGMTLLDCYKEEIEQNKNDKKVAIVGGGPAGLTCAAFLAKAGVQVTIYEKYDYLGGLLVHGIPEFRLTKDIVEKTIQMILDLGIDVEYNKELGKNLNIKDLEKEFDAVFLSFGANISSKMGVEGENLNGVYGGNELLEHNLHPNYEGKITCVVGGGNVAMDCARTIKRLGAKEVKVIYRRSREEMPAEDKEVEEAINEGIEFLYQNNIVKIIGKEKVEKIELIKTELVQKEGETRKSPVNIEGSNYVIDADYVVMALGAGPENIVEDLDLTLTKWCNIMVDESYKTSNPKIFAGGDLAGTKGTVAWAARSGRDSADSIIHFLNI